MYLITALVGVKFGIHKEWQNIDASSVSVASLYATYRKMWLTVRMAPEAPALYLDMDDLRNEAITYSSTLFAYLGGLGNRTLPTRPLGVTLKKRTAKYKDCFQAGYTITPVNRANSDNASVASQDKTDVRLTRTTPLTDYTAFQKSCLVSINGFYHLTDTDGVKGVVVADAMTSLRHSQQNQIGLYSFHTVCQFESLPITADMVQQNTLAQPIVTLPRDLTGKTVMLVLGGYLHAIDPTVLVRVGERAYRIDFDALPFLERYMESQRYLDLSSLPVEHGVNNPEQFTLASLKSNATVLAYLLLSQTFFVILDCEEIYAQKQFVKRTGMPDMYIAYTEPTYPLVSELGRQPEYWYRQDDGQYLVTVYDNLVGNKLFNTALPTGLVSTDEDNVPTRAKHISAAHFLEVGRDI